MRAAAAVALIRLGWGLGLGSLSLVALYMLEEIVGVPLGERAAGLAPQLSVRHLASVSSLEPSTPLLASGTPSSRRMGTPPQWEQP